MRVPEGADATGLDFFSDDQDPPRWVPSGNTSWAGRRRLPFTTGRNASASWVRSGKLTLGADWLRSGTNSDAVTEALPGQKRAKRMLASFGGHAPARVRDLTAFHGPPSRHRLRSGTEGLGFDRGQEVSAWFGVPAGAAGGPCRVPSSFSGCQGAVGRLAPALIIGRVRGPILETPTGFRQGKALPGRGQAWWNSTSGTDPEWSDGLGPVVRVARALKE